VGGEFDSNPPIFTPLFDLDDHCCFRVDSGPTRSEETFDMGSAQSHDKDQ